MRVIFNDLNKKHFIINQSYMRKAFVYLGIAAMAVSVNACQTEKLDQGIHGETDFSISTSIPSGLVTYASNQGGIFNVDPEEYDLRFTMEVYDGDALAYSDSYIVKDNFETASATFEMRLLAKEYDFVFFADFITEDGISYYDLTDGLDNIRLTGRVYGNDAVDSYYKKEVIDLSTSGSSKTVTLKRKFGKIRLLATDKVDNTGNTAPGSVKIEYKETEVPACFNARTGETTSAVLNNEVFTYNVGEKETVAVGQNTVEAYLVGFDYIIPSDIQTSYSFNITVYDENGIQIGSREISSIPVKENMLTTVIGNFYSNEGSLEVIVDDEFDSETVIEDGEEVTVSAGADLAKIIREAEAGTTIYLEEGEYSCPEGIIINKPVKIIGAPDHKSVISSASNSSATIWLKGDIAGTVIDGIQVYGAFKDNLSGSSDAIAIWGSGTEDSPVIIRNCIISKPDDLAPTIQETGYLGISTTYGDFGHFIIENNTISDANYGMYFNSISNSVIRNNNIEKTRRGGIVIGADGGEQYRCSNVQITGNTLSEISWAGKSGVYDYALSIAGQYGENITESDNTVSYAESASEGIKAVDAYGFDITGESLSDMVSSAADGATIRLEANTTYDGDVTVPAGKHIRIIGSEDNSTKITGQITVSQADLYIENVTVEGTKNGLYSEGMSSIEARNCVFNITPNESNNNTAVMTWTWKGENEKVYLTNCVFNAEGVRTVQLRKVADAKIEGCTFNSPYTYAVQLDEAGTNLTFNNNTVNNAQSAIYVHSGTTASSVSMSGNTCNNVIYPYCGRPQALNDASNTGMDDFWYYVTENADSNNNFTAAGNRPGRTVALAGSFSNLISLSSANNGQKIYGPNWNIDPTADEASLKTNWTISSQIKFAYDMGSKILEDIEIRGLYIKGGYMNQQYGGLKNVTVEKCAFIGNTASTNGFISHIGSHSATENYVLKNNLFRTEDGTVSSRIMLWGSPNEAEITFEGNRLDKAFLHIDGAVNAKVSDNYIDVTGLDMIYNVIIAGGSESYVSEFTGNTYKGASFCVYYLYNGNFIYGQNIRTTGDSYYGTPNLIGLRGASIDDKSLTFEGYSSAVYRPE